MHLMCCAASRHSISELYAAVDEYFQAMEAMRQRMENLEHVVDDDYMFLIATCENFLAWLGTLRASGAIVAGSITRFSFPP
jgi:hypothetical protein